MFHRPWIYLGVFLMVGLMIQGLAAYGPGSFHFALPHYYYNSYVAFVFALGFGLFALLTAGVPLAAVLPAGDTIVLDRQSGMWALLSSRTGRSQAVVWGKALAASIGAGVMTAVSLAATWLLDLAWYPLGLPHRVNLTMLDAHPLAGVAPVGYQPYFASQVFWHHPGWYVLLVAGLLTWAVMCFALVPLALSRWVSNRYVALVLPIVLFFLVVSGLQPLHRYAWTPLVAAGGYLAQGGWHWWSLMIYWAVPAAGALLILSRPHAPHDNLPTHQLEV